MGNCSDNSHTGLVREAEEISLIIPFSSCCYFGGSPDERTDGEGADDTRVRTNRSNGAQTVVTEEMCKRYEVHMYKIFLKGYVWSFINIIKINFTESGK